MYITLICTYSHAHIVVVHVLVLKAKARPFVALPSVWLGWVSIGMVFPSLGEPDPHTLHHLVLSG